MAIFIDVGLLLLPSLRAIAYWDVMEKMSALPREVVWMAGAVPMLAEMRDENRLHGYDRTFFDLRSDLYERINASGVEIRAVASRDVNSAAVRTALRDCKCADFVFTGGGILTPETLSLGKRFVHVHPGLVPDFRGSTCFYYSLLTNFTLGATAFIMNERIDTGAVVATAEFQMNCRIGPDQPLFMDYIVDPYIRAATLRRALERYMASGPFSGVPQQACSQPAYYVMHPLLRHLAINRINRSYDPSRKQGIFELETRETKS